MSHPHTLLGHLPYFRQQSAEVVAELAALAVRCTFRANEVVFWEGEPCAGLFVVESGAVKICRVSREGREYILRFAESGESFNEVSVLDGEGNPATVTALDDTVLWRIEREDLRRNAMRHPEVAWALMEFVARHTRFLVGEVQNLALRNVRARLAYMLLVEAERQQSDAVPRLLTQEEMASRLGTVREVVGRALRGMVADGLLAFDRHRIVILDWERLASEAEA